MGTDRTTSLGELSPRRRRRLQPMADINTTSIVGVMLVLLIIFMVTAPLMTVSAPNGQPQASLEHVGDSKNPLVISVDATGRILLQGKELKPSEIAPKLTAISKSGFNERIYIRGDKKVMFGKLSNVMGHISGAGFKHITVITDAVE
jgi:biopolymer transport protein TolR